MGPKQTYDMITCSHKRTYNLHVSVQGAKCFDKIDLASTLEPVLTLKCVASDVSTRNQKNSAKKICSETVLDLFHLKNLIKNCIAPFIWKIVLTLTFYCRYYNYCTLTREKQNPLLKPKICAFQSTVYFYIPRLLIKHKVPVLKTICVLYFRELKVSTSHPYPLPST